MIKPKKEACLITPEDILPTSRDYRVIGAFNPAAVRQKDRDIMLLIRVAEKLIQDEDKLHYFSPRMVGKRKHKRILDKFTKKNVKSKGDLDFVFKDGTKRLTFISHFRRIILSPDGLTIKHIEQKPSFFGIAKDGELGIEDPRITPLGNKYLMTYVALSRAGNISTSYAVSKDLRKWKREGIIFSEQNKDVVIFPEKISGKYYAINRPEGTFQFSSPHMWMVESENFNHWDEPFSLILDNKGGWDAGRVGAGPPPIKTSKGWLLFYHGVIEKNKRETYSAGAALLDLRNPRKVIAKTKRPIILPTQDYEKGTIEKKDVVFPTGIVMHENNEDILIFSGGGDLNTTVKQFSLKEIMRCMRRV